MMYGYGDSKNPLPETMELMEELAKKYITEMTREAVTVARKRGSKKVSEDDVLYLINEEISTHDRAVELLQKDEELRKARQLHIKRE